MQVLSLRPQPQGDFVGEMAVTVKTNECRQQGGVIRIPTEASRSGDSAARSERAGPGAHKPDDQRTADGHTDVAHHTVGPALTPSPGKDCECSLSMLAWLQADDFGGKQ